MSTKETQPETIARILGELQNEIRKLQDELFEANVKICQLSKVREAP